MQLPADWTEDDENLTESRILSVLDSTDGSKNPVVALDWCADHAENTCWYCKIIKRKYIIENDTGELCSYCRGTQKKFCIDVSFKDGQKETKFDPNDSSIRWVIQKRG